MIEGEEDSGTEDADGYRDWSALGELSVHLAGAGGQRAAEHRSTGAGSAESKLMATATSPSPATRNTTDQEQSEFLASFSSGQVRHKHEDRKPTTVPPPSRMRKGKSRSGGGGVAGMDRVTAGKMDRGELEPSARLDLHHHNFEEARRELDRFVRGGLAAGHRLLLVITGQGHNSPTDDSVMGQRQTLRQAFPGWVTAADWQVDIVRCCPAHPTHGGAGAYYLYLKQQK